MATMPEVTWKMVTAKRGGDRFLKIWVTSRDIPIEKHLFDKRRYCVHFAQWIKKAGDFSHIDIYVNSPGGSVTSVCGMLYALGIAGFRGKKIRVLIDGRCDSAATLLLKLSWPVYITETSSVYIHMPSSERFRKTREGFVWVGVSKTGLRNTVGLFEGAYLHRVKMNGKKMGRKSEIRELMAKGHRFSAKEAVGFGLCDRIMSREEFDKG